MLLRISADSDVRLNQAFAHGYESSALQQYGAYYAGIDPYPQLFSQTVEGVAYASEDFYSREQFLRSQYFNEFLKPQNNYYCGGGYAVHEVDYQAQIRFSRGLKGDFFNKEELKSIEFLFPHIKKSLNLSKKLLQAEAKLQIVDDAFNKMSIGQLFFDANKKVVHFNRAAIDILREAYGLDIRQGKFCAKSHALQIKIDAVLARIVEGQVGAADAALNIPSPKPHLSPLNMVFCPTRQLAPPLDYISQPTVATLFIMRVEQKLQYPYEILEALYQLTPAESRLVNELINGYELNEIASHLQVSKNTVRSQLQSIFAKTQTRRQAELVSSLLKAPILLSSTSKRR
ncbi:MAG: helix-turn-helix transcriptional regulator [Gammaproteobacteria bacterium]|nr:helix-turn-helix transcriptional regulator [Gammaproteobacteria bacterium]